MGENTKIEWADHTASFWEGCAKVSLGCKNCYAEAFERRMGRDIWGHRRPRKLTSGGPALIRRLNRKAEKAGRKATVFVNDLADFFEDHDGPVLDHQGLRVWCDPEDKMYREHQCFPGRTDSMLRDAGMRPLTLDDLRAAAFRLFDECQHLIFMLLTKRPENIRRMWADQIYDSENWFFDPAEQKRRGLDDAGPHKGQMVQVNACRSNVWLGTSIESQAYADRRVPHLLAVRDLSPVLFVSAEPLLECIDLQHLQPIDPPTEIDALNGTHGVIRPHRGTGPFLDWVIVGGESGRNPRPCRPEWIRSIVRQCSEAGVPCFAKQMGANVVTRNDAVEDVFNNGQSGWPDPDVEHHINGFREDYQGAECRIRLRHPKGGDQSEWPEDLRVREFPKVLEASI